MEYTPMKLAIFNYNQSGWSQDPLPAFDSESTLVVVFGAAEWADDPAPVRELAAAYPRAHLVGCSTAGEIFGTGMSDGSLSVAVARFEAGTRIATAAASVCSPALELYKEYLGDLAAGLPATGLLFPLALRSDSSADKTLVRTILAVDEAGQSMTFAGDIPQGSLARLMRANFDRLIDGASDAAGLASPSLADEDRATLAIAISCVGRRLVLGERAEEEIEATLEVMPTGTQQIGFYSYGEISPYATGRCDLHNQTMTLTTIRETRP